MPPRRKTLARRTLHTEDESLVRHALRTGRDWFRLLSDPGSAEYYWREFGPGIMEQWARENPGTRPWAWWEFDAPDRRRCIEGRDVLADPGRPAHLRKTSFGVPVCWTPEEMRDPSTYESETDFLERHGLLTPEEKALIDAG